MSNFTGFSFPMVLIGVFVLGLLGLGCLVRCKGKIRDSLARTAVVFLSALALYFGGMLLLGFFGMTWRNLASALFFGTLLVSGWAGVVLTVACVLDQKWSNIPILLEWAGKALVCFLAAEVLLVTLWIGPFLLLFGFTDSERTVEYQGQTLLEVDDGFLDPHYSYYAYHGPLVRGIDRIYDGPTSIYGDIG